jgi:hypothetical protein
MYFQYDNLLDRANFHHQVQTTAHFNQVQPHPVSASDLAISVFPISFFVGWTGFFLIVSKLRRTVVDKMIVTTNSLNKVRCQNCRFYSNNRYLNCAVQPSIVLTKDAENCTDYCPKNANLRHQKSLPS